MIFIIGRGFAERQILKKWKWPYLLNWVEYFDKLLRKRWYWQDLAQEIAKCHFSLVEALPSSKSNSEKVIMALSLEMSGILWRNFAYTLILTRCTPWDCQMTFEIGWVFSKVQILKKVRLLQNLSLVEALPSSKFWKSENGLISWTEWYILINFCVNIDIIKI